MRGMVVGMNKTEHNEMKNFEHDNVDVEHIRSMYAQNRTKLMDAIPLKLPLCISIEPSNLCNFKCTMCYHGNNEYAEGAKPLKNIDMDCFQKVVDDITSWTRATGGAD